jgi:ribosomal protein L15
VEEKKVEAPVEEKKVVEPAPAPVVEEFHVVDHIAASEVDSLMTDAQAVNAVTIIAATTSGKMGAINVGTLNDHFVAGEKVDIASLKAKKLISADCKRVKILADGDLNKSLVVEADSFSLQAIKMITLTGGQAIKLQANAPKADEEAPQA